MEFSTINYLNRIINNIKLDEKSVFDKKYSKFGKKRKLSYLFCKNDSNSLNEISIKKCFDYLQSNMMLTRSSIDFSLDDELDDELDDKKQLVFEEQLNFDYIDLGITLERTDKGDINVLQGPIKYFCK